MGDTNAPIEHTSLLSSSERQQVLFQFNETVMDYPQTRMIHEIFEEQVRRNPEVPAIVYKGQSLTYSQLNHKANQVAHYLVARGVHPDAPVGLYVDRSLDLFVGLMGILKAGGAYVPLDAESVRERLEYMLTDTGARVVLTQKRLYTRLPEGVQALAIDSQWEQVAQFEHRDIATRSMHLTPRNLAYVIYTSGSTGQPKGVQVEHRSVVNVWKALSRMYSEPHNCQRIAVNAPFTFDASVKQIVQLLSGRTLYLIPQALRLDAHGLLKYLQSEGIEGIDCTPSQLEVWIAAGLLDQNREFPVTVSLGGEAVDENLWARLARCTNIAFYNLYGPTECTVDSTGTVIEQGSLKPHIGRPLSNVRIYILDASGSPVPVGVVGELHISGAGVARGYLNRPDLTESKFVRDPFVSDAKARMYKTGDLGRWRSDGTIEYVGRIDNQVKIRGHRVELGEVEATLLRYPQLKDAVVVARGDESGLKRLVGYVTVDLIRSQPQARKNSDGDREPNDVRGAPHAQAHSGSALSAERLRKQELMQNLRQFLGERLPAYMIPNALIVLEKFPLKDNGKIDREALPEPDLLDQIDREYEPAEGPLELKLANIWQDVLKVERVGRQDDFFELGGHSLLIARVMEQLRHVGLFTDVSSLFKHSTLTAMASTLRTHQAVASQVPPNLIPPGCQAITPDLLPLIDLSDAQIAAITSKVSGGAANIQDIYPLAPLQQGMFFHHLLSDRDWDPYIILVLFSLSSPQTARAFTQALQKVVDRHDILRTAVMWEELPRPVQVVYRRAVLQVETLELDPARNALEQMKEHMRSGAWRLDVRRAPLLQLQVAQDYSTERCYALLKSHHMTHDHISLDILLGEVRAIIDGKEHDLPSPVPFRNHVAEVLASEQGGSAEVFFRTKLSGVYEPTVPFGIVSVDADGSRTRELRRSLDATLSAEVRRVSRGLNLSAAILFHAAWGMVVAHTSHRQDIVYGTLLSGQMKGTTGDGRMVGVLINTLPLRLRLDHLTALELITQTRSEMAELLNHEHASLALAQRCSSVGGGQPLFTSLLNYFRGTPTPEIAPPGGLSPDVLHGQGVSDVQVVDFQERTNYPLALSVADRGDDFVLTVQTDNEIDPQRVISYMSTALASLSLALAQESKTPVLDLAIIPNDEIREVIEVFNATETPFTRDTKLIHQLVEAQVERVPDAVALQQGDQSLTYAELNRRANQLARYLKGKGVGPEDVVAVCLERTLDLAVALLGILKAGGAYLPIDPDYPAERIRYLLIDSSPRVLLKQKTLTPEFAQAAASVITMDDELTRSELRLIRDQNLDVPALNPCQKAYVIYTSGSTGEPKGVMIEHRNLHNLVDWHIRAFQLDGKTRSSSMAGLGFDASTWEVWPPLCSGGTMVLAETEASVDSEELLNWWQQQDLDVSFLVTPLAEFAYASGKINPRVRDLLIGGDRLRRMPESIPAGQRLVNNYGPTETAVVATSGRLTRDDDILHIGRPIDNTRIYIVDESLRPMPVGVSGEIVIGGESVGRGYLGRPTLTAERFIADPFSPGLSKRVYRTGDLARWRFDGSIEYLGRNDAQVKIRGFRIEPREIEAKLGSHWQVKEVVVAVREDAPGEKSLVAYVIRRDDIEVGDLLSVEALRIYLKARLPAYMVPSAIVFLEKFPLSPNGKVDPRALPPPKAGAQASSEFELPQGGLETALAEIWRSVLKAERVGRHDNFFELGGHSLLVLEAVSRMNSLLGGAWRVADIYRNPTIHDLAAYREGRLSDDRVVELQAEAVIDDSIMALPGQPRHPSQAVLVTGATGFVGRFLVAQLLQETDSRIYCLVRAQSETEAWWRLRSTLQRWDLWRDEFGERAIAIPGDLRKANLGISGQNYETLCSTLDCIFHCGASMNHLESYGMAKAANVESVREVLKLATRVRPKLVNYISSLGVFHGSPHALPRVIQEESSIDYERHRYSAGYVASKWVAEKILLNARERGIPCNIFRLGLVWADAQEGRYDELQREYRIFKTCLLSGYGIRDYKFQLPPSPVDYVSQAILALARLNQDGRGTFHISAPHGLVNGVFEYCNEALGTALELKSFYEWIGEIKRLHSMGRSLPAVPLVEKVFALDESAFDEYERALGFGTTRFDCTRTWQQLERAGIIAPTDNAELLRGFLESMYLRDADFGGTAQLVRSGRRRVSAGSAYRQE